MYNLPVAASLPQDPRHKHTERKLKLIKTKAERDLLQAEIDVEQAEIDRLRRLIDLKQTAIDDDQLFPVTEEMAEALRDDERIRKAQNPQ